MDKRFIPLSQIERIKKTISLQQIQLNPDWPIHVIAKFI